MQLIYRKYAMIIIDAKKYKFKFLFAYLMLISAGSQILQNSEVTKHEVIRGYY